MTDTIVIDTNVLVSALQSSQGASYQLLRRIKTDEFHFVLSTALVLEYESILKRKTHKNQIELSKNDIDNILDYMCLKGIREEIFYLWRPVLNDPADDMILELAVSGDCDYIVTFNKRDFAEASTFGIKLVTPFEFLQKTGSSS